MEKKQILVFSSYRKIPLISRGPIQLRKGFGWAYKRGGGGGGLYPRKLITGIKSFLNKVIRNK